ncbi:MAG TPA: mechanosensitive ion channel, partial [Burkholderiaceae bacterium]|nr:mechanosensitive ion channel [Burkholderiaceae bacterium]
QALQTQLHDATAQVATRMDKVLNQRERLESTAIWRLGEDAGTSVSAVSKRLEGSALLLRAYFVRHGGELALTVGLCCLRCLWLFRRAAPATAPAAQRAWNRPLAASLLIALVALFWFAPNPPIVFYSLLVLAIALPMARLGRLAFAAAAPRTLNGLALAIVVFALRSLIDASALADRLLLLVQLASFTVPLALDLRGGGLYRAFARFTPESVRAAALVVLGLCALSALHALFGSAGPSRGVRVGAAGVIGFGFIFTTTAMALYGALLALLATPLLGWLRSARQPDPALLRALRVVLFLIAAGSTVVTTLGAMTLVPDALSVLDSAARSTVDIGVLTVSTAALATALAVVIGTFVLSAVVHFVLDREVFPRLQLRAGAGYAISTFARWLIFIAGGVLTLAALGVDPTRITLLAGAVGVGVGFGLQSVVNNFVSGLILIVERPVAVGDLIEIGPLLGAIQRIGIRSSSVRTTHGAEVIVPNSDLASKEVINWTRSDRQRRYDIDVGVAYGSDPKQVMRLLVEAAREVPEVMAEPAPMAMFKGFGDSSLDFRLLAWVSTIDLGLQAQNALRIAVLAKLDAAGITMPFPQRDVHLIAPPAASPS